MGTTFRPYHPDQILMLPPDLREWVPEGHLAHHVSDLVDAVDLSAFHAPYEGDGRRNSPYDPRMMVKVLIYAYATGTFSSRKMAKRLEEDVALRMLAAGNFPKHRTLCEFRRRHLGDFRAVFAEVVVLARASGLAGLGRVSVDGTKVRANASKRKAMSWGRMVREEPRLEAEIRALKAKIKGLLEEAEATDEAEDGRYGEDARGDELPEELRRREDRLAAIRAAKALLEAEQREADDARGRKPGQKRNPKGGRPYKRPHGEPDEAAQSNFTDPESRIMRTSTEGFQQCYNAQAVVEGENQLVIGAEVTDNASDQGQLIPMIDAAATVCGETPDQVLADAGYGNEKDLRELEKRGIDGYVALAREGKAPAKVDPDEYPARARMAEKLVTEEGRRRYARRKWQAEAPIGWIKEAMGFRRFSFRGLEKVQAEWTLVCLALNIKRLHTLQAA
jgi:transposase